MANRGDQKEIEMTAKEKMAQKWLTVDFLTPKNQP
jgi:hypothetical protein